MAAAYAITAIAPRKNMMRPNTTVSARHTAQFRLARGHATSSVPWKEGKARDHKDRNDAHETDRKGASPIVNSRQAELSRPSPQTS